MNESLGLNPSSVKAAVDALRERGLLYEQPFFRNTPAPVEPSEQLESLPSVDELLADLLTRTPEELERLTEWLSEAPSLNGGLALPKPRTFDIELPSAAALRHIREQIDGIESPESSEESPETFETLTAAHAKRVEPAARRPVAPIDIDVAPRSDATQRQILNHLTRAVASHTLQNAPGRRLASPSKAVFLATGEDASGRIENDGGRAKATPLIDAYLSDNLPVLVGVSGQAGGDDLDGVTDHHVVINGKGYDEAGRLYYTFADPKAEDGEGRFYVDEQTGKLFQEKAEGPYYEVTRIHVYN